MRNRLGFHDYLPRHVAAYGSYGHTGQIPVGALCRPPPARSTSSLTDNHSPQRRQVPKQATGPGTTQTEPATGRQQGSQSAKVSVYPSLRRHVLSAGAERPHREHSTLVLARQQHAGGGAVGLGDDPAAPRRGVVGRKQPGAVPQRALVLAPVCAADVPQSSPAWRESSRKQPSWPNASRAPGVTTTRPRGNLT